MENGLHTCEQDTLEKIRQDTEKVMEELLPLCGMKRGSLMAVGCSSSEITGGRIGKYSSYDAAQAVYEVIAGHLESEGIYLAAQCCEHLNRSLVVEREAAERFGCEIVCAVPRPKAGGSFATAAWRSMTDPVLVQEVRADAGLDIGLTLIGMHLKAVAVPVRLTQRTVGQAVITCARTRPRYVGGARAVYEEEK